MGAAERKSQHLDKGHGLFFWESLRSLSVTASICPSSRFLAAALLRPVDFSTARVVVDLGAGTGAITHAILRRMRPDAVLYALDVNPAFISHLEEKIHDSRVVPILGGAERLGEYLGRHGVRKADAVISSLGLSAMGPDLRAAIAGQVAAHLAEGGVMTQYQYIRGIGGFDERDFLQRYFRQVALERVILNLPPANVFTCRL